MAHAQIRQIDPTSRSVVIALDDGREVKVSFPAGANIEVMEPSTLGTMGGTLDDLKVGYWVEVTLDDHAGHACSCTSLVCLS